MKALALPPSSRLRGRVAVALESTSTAVEASDTVAQGTADRPGQFVLPGVSITYDPSCTTIARVGAWVAISSAIDQSDMPRWVCGDTSAESTLDPSTLAQWLETFKRSRVNALAALRGPFSIIVIDLNERAVYLAVDRFAIRTLCYRLADGFIEFSDRADAIERGADNIIDPQSIYNYLYFHVIPSPRTIFSGIERVPPAHRVSVSRDGVRRERYWRPDFERRTTTPLPALKAEFLELVEGAVRRHAEHATLGTFLSGGTDSSTVAGMLRRVTGSAARTFAIGFDAEGYDEMEYARIAARHFGTDHTEYYVTPDDLVAGISEVAASYDQPFGNSSVVPAFLCARVARDKGVDKLLAGDGGDELFGGNTRYAKQRVFELYGRMPGPLRSAIVEPTLLESPLGRLPGLRKVASYVRQARTPLPDRLHTYNLLERVGRGSLFTRAFRDRVNEDEPELAQRATYADCDASSYVNRMLAYDWVYTLAENDIPKVIGATRLAGVDVGFPLLDEGLLEFSLGLAPDLKVRGIKLRYLFKEALRGFLPDAIITKKKHGFGLPFGVWAVRHDALRKFAADHVRSIGERGFIEPAFVRPLLEDYLPQHPGYYGELVWILMMLEAWLRHHAPNYKLEG